MAVRNSIRTPRLAAGMNASGSTGVRKSAYDLARENEHSREANSPSCTGAARHGARYERAVIPPE
jgi:hypothetical protein